MIELLKKLKKFKKMKTIKLYWSKFIFIGLGNGVSLQQFEGLELGILSVNRPRYTEDGKDNPDAGKLVGNAGMTIVRAEDFTQADSDPDSIFLWTSNTPMRGEEALVKLETDKWGDLTFDIQQNWLSIAVDVGYNTEGITDETPMIEVLKRVFKAVDDQATLEGFFGTN